MRRRILLSALLMASLTVPAAAQDLLPPAFSGWATAAARVNFRPGALEELAGDEADILREYGILSAERGAYSRGSETLTVTLYRLRDPSAAYGVYTYLRTDQMATTPLTRYSSISSHRALVLEGNLLLDVAGARVPSLEEDLKTLLLHLAPYSARTPYPTLGQYLPTRGLARNSERYLLGPLALKRVLPIGEGDWVGFGDGAEAELARYRLNGREITLLLASYPTPQAAARKLEQLARVFALNSSDDLDDGRPVLFARRSSSLLAFVPGTRSRALADSLLSQIHYQNQVTWNEPGHTATDPNILQSVVGAMIGTGLILLFALIAGIGFGGVRLLVKHFFPGKVFDRSRHVEILQLGLSSKPIEAKDFY